MKLVCCFVLEFTKFTCSVPLGSIFPDVSVALLYKIELPALEPIIPPSRSVPFVFLKMTGLLILLSVTRDEVFNCPVPDSAGSV